MYVLSYFNISSNQTYYCGILLDWCRPVDNKSRINIIAHWVTRTFIFVLLLVLDSFYIFQLVMDLMWQTNLHRIIPNLTWFIAYACGLFSFSYYNLQQRKLLSFFKHWENFEINFSNKSDTGASSALVKQKRLAKFMYVSYFVITCGCLLGFCNSLRSSNASFMLSHYQILRDTLTIPFVVTIHLIAISLVWVSFSLLDIVPAIIFYSASK